MSEREILIVDDDATMLRILQALLTARGHRVHIASGGEEALAALATLSLDAMIVDVMMPVMDGIELVRRLRARSDLPQVAARMLSAASAMPGRFDHHRGPSLG
ncbi:MAG: response regulator [Candidatus Dormibacteria bacterium]